MADDPWSPERYGRFAEERKRPFLDLLTLVRARPAMRIVDLGCGTGELTRLMHERLGASTTLGIDASAAMLEQSSARADDDLRFERGDIANFRADRAYDLVFSNSALHWLPDHAALFERLTAALAGGGQLAVQVPANFDHPSHVVASEMAAEPPFADALGGRAHAEDVLAPEAYAVLLECLGYRDQHVRLQVYGHRLAAPESVVEWVEGSLLTDYRRRLPADLYARFVARYRERLLPRLEDVRPYLFTFKRILVWAQH
jgi:trans-aconitate 2-methyltransferase